MALVQYGAMKTYKADLHVHSRHSNKPSYWAMRKFNCPESYTTPERIYHTVRERGMDFVTISDHNCIDGALEIGHLPGTFISSEITTVFPENGCRAKRFNAFTEQFLFGLDESYLTRLANKHDLAPNGPIPWRKSMASGSDDHGGLFIARTHTAIRSSDSWTASSGD